MELTTEEAYLATYYYLEHLFEETQADELRGILGDMSLLDDGRPADAAVWDDWLQAVERAKTDKSGARLRITPSSRDF